MTFEHDAIGNGSVHQFQPGQAVGGRYQVVSLLGRGGMGVVYRVNQIFLSKEFALKTIDKRFMSAIVIRRFQQEARTAFALDHPNIITVNDFGVLDDLTPFLVMELIKGETLGERLKRAGRLTVEEAIPIFVQVCFGLAHAHEHGIVHRDIKPNNIMILDGSPGAEANVKILDFGIAKFVEHEGGEIQALTRTGEVFGTPMYMSPEQCIGTRVDHRADVYSLGCVFFEALTGAPPCIGENALATMLKHQTERALTLRQASLGAEFPQAIEDIVARMLAKSPDDRYQNLGIVAHDLGALRRGDSISRTTSQTAAASREKTISMSGSKFYGLLLGIAVLSAAIAGGVGYGLHKSVSPEIVTSNKNQTEPTTFVSKEEGKLVDDSVNAVMPTEELKKDLLDPTPDKKFSLINKTLSDQSFALISNAAWIHSLSLKNCLFTNNEGFDRLAKLPLSGIKLDGSNFNNVGAAKLSQCQGLEDVSAPGTNISDEGVVKLSSIKGLKNLNIGQCEITDEGLVALAKSRELVYLDVRKNKRITNLGFRALEQSRLQVLILDGIPIDDSALVPISKIGNLENLNLSGTNVTFNGVKKLCKSSKSLQTLRLKNCHHVEAKEVQQLKEEFPSISIAV
jgi:serine/threonine protein kinase